MGVGVGRESKVKRVCGCRGRERIEGEEGVWV